MKTTFILVMFLRKEKETNDSLSWCCHDDAILDLFDVQFEHRQLLYSVSDMTHKISSLSSMSLGREKENLGDAILWDVFDMRCQFI